MIVCNCKRLTKTSDGRLACRQDNKTVQTFFNCYSCRELERDPKYDFEKEELFVNGERQTMKSMIDLWKKTGERIKLDGDERASFGFESYYEHEGDIMPKIVGEFLVIWKPSGVIYKVLLSDEEFKYFMS